MNRKNSYSPFPNKTTNKQFYSSSSLFKSIFYLDTRNNRICIYPRNDSSLASIISRVNDQSSLDPPFASSLNVYRTQFLLYHAQKKKKKLSPLLPAILTLRYFNSREIAKMAGESSGNRNYSN